LDLTTKDQQDGWNALERLLRIARTDTGQARRVASFLLAWRNAEENGGWDPTDLWNVDAAIADDMLTVVRLIRYSHHSIAPSFGRRQTRVTSAMFGTRHPCLISRSEARQSYLRLTP
jgi:hypothetical protein